MSKERINFIDFLRGIAVILMFITHSYRLQISNPGTWLPNQLKLDYLFNFFMYIEPFTSALFLFLAGYSFSIFSEKVSYSTLKKEIVKKSVILISLSWFINLLLYSNKGLFLDHLFLSSGILQAIAIALLLNLFLFQKKYLCIGLFGVLAVELFLELSQLSILGLNAGAGCIIPVIGYSFLGNIFHKTQFKYLNLGIIFVIFGILFNAGWRYDVNYSLFNIIQSNNVNFSNWNHSLVGFILNSSILMILFNNIKNINLKLNLINSLGKHSLTVYVFHLVLISLFYYKSWGLANPTESLLFIGALLVGSNYLIKIKKLIFRGR